jgi:hypothetical protein
LGEIEGEWLLAAIGVGSRKDEETAGESGPGDKQESP